MADIKTTITITLTDDNLKEAVSLWLNSCGGIPDITYWRPDHVHVAARMQIVGHGVNEREVPVVVVEARHG